jgi:hypothetical protein
MSLGASIGERARARRLAAGAAAAAAGRRRRRPVITHEQAGTHSRLDDPPSERTRTLWPQTHGLLQY